MRDGERRHDAGRLDAQQQVAVFPENIAVLNLNAFDLRDFPQASFDLVTALDAGSTTVSLVLSSTEAPTSRMTRMKSSVQAPMNRQENSRAM